MLEDTLYMKTVLICYVIICSFVLIILVLGNCVKSRSEKYEIPRYWARPWILTSNIVGHLIFCCVYFGDYTNLGARLSIASTASSKISTALLGFHVLTSFYNPYILSGKRQLVVWITLIVAAWIIGITFTLVAVQCSKVNYFGHNQPAEMTTSGYNVANTTSGYGNFYNTTSLLDSLNIDFNTKLWTSSPVFVSNATYIDSVEYTEINGKEVCYMDTHYELFYPILSIFYFLPAILVLPAVQKKVLHKITRCFKSCHSPLSPSQKLVCRWIEQQNISSALFIELHTVYIALHFACDVDFREHCMFVFRYVDILYPTIFALSCFILNDVRNMLINLCSACRRRF